MKESQRDKTLAFYFIEKLIIFKIKIVKDKEN